MDGVNVSVHMLSTAGYYIEALNMMKRSISFESLSPILKDKVCKIDRDCLPTANYISWELNMAEMDL
ncbi:MAG: hypothetical protein LBF57_04480 [Holosporaceae bacterium]|jgi:hypothetical protein|nr:hypothetical protein [Holosporaceae bacterium]